MKRLLAALAACLVLAGCTRTLPGSDAAAPPPVSAPSASPAPSPAAPRVTGLRALQDSSGFVYGAAGPDGFYSISAAAADGSTLIQYTDYASMQTLPLCAAPACAHDSDACTAWLPYNGSGTSLMMAEDVLVLVTPGQGTQYEQLGALCLPGIQVCAPDGSNRRLLVRFEANQTLRPPYLTDGSCLYATLQTDTAQELTRQLLCIDLASGKTSTLMELDGDHAEGVLGASGEYIFSSQLSDASQQAKLNLDYSTELYRFNVNTGSRELVAVCPIDSCRRALFGKTLVTYDGTCGRLSVFDCVENRQTAVADSPLPIGPNAELPDLIFYDEPFLLIGYRQHPEDLARRFAVVDVSTGQSREFSLCYSVGEHLLPCYPIAKTGDGRYFLVMGESEAPPAQTGDGYIWAGSYQYGIMDRADYWAGTP